MNIHPLYSSSYPYTLTSSPKISDDYNRFQRAEINAEIHRAKKHKETCTINRKKRKSKHKKK